MIINSRLKSFAFIFLITFFSLNAYASIESIQKDLNKNTNNSFQTLIEKWEKKYGTKIVPSLLKYAKDKSNSDQHRYITLMASAKMGGPKISKLLKPFFKDSSWMIRSAALKIASAFGKSSSFDSEVKLLLHDKAWVVRSEAIDTLCRTKPKGYTNLLIESLFDPTNYHKGKAQFIPKKILNNLEQNSLSLVQKQKIQSLAKEKFLKDAEFIKDLKKSMQS